MNHLEMLESWLKSLPDDIRAFTTILSDESLPEEPRRLAAGVINYLFKSVDLIPDGLDDIGYLDDILTMRLAATLLDRDAVARARPDLAQALERLARDASAARDMLDEPVYSRFLDYTRDLAGGSARGRSAGEIVTNAFRLQEVLMEADDFRDEYEVPSIEKTERTLTKLRSFLDARLPR
jgi:uncharacterized membrane protein YkvA (DUF1232 family)